MIGVVIALVLGLITWGLDRRRRKYADRAVTPAAALFAGLNLVRGRGWSEQPLAAHRTGIPSLWWEYVVEEERRQTRTVSDGKGGTRVETTTNWHTIETRRDLVPQIEVVDDTGSALVRLEGASVVPEQVHSQIFTRNDMTSFLGRLLRSGNGATGRYRETERVLRYGADLFVVGECELDESRLVPVVAKKVMVSTRTVESHVRWLTVGVVSLLLATMVALTLGIASLIQPGDLGNPAGLAPGVAASLVLLAVAWGIVTYNRLKMVAESADRAWSLVDVQLRRRHDLIPALQQCVAAHAAHEQSTQVSLAQARAAVGAAGPSDEATALSDEAELQTQVLRQLVALAEAYPQLTADASFARLQRELADTEDRIAASRSFYNDSLTILKNRCAKFPDLLIANRIRLDHRELIEARGFERTVPPVRHAFDTPPVASSETGPVVESSAEPEADAAGEPAAGT